MEKNDLSKEEIDGIKFIREKEKPARDVYMHLYDPWNGMPFNNISKSGRAHMDAILMLINRSVFEDPAKGMKYSEFQNPDIQDLYDELIAKGEKSLIDAHEVGAIIEENDIRDIQHLIDQLKGNKDIELLFKNLMK